MVPSPNACSADNEKDNVKVVARGSPPAPSVVVPCGGVGPPSPPWLGFAPPRAQFRGPFAFSVVVVFAVVGPLNRGRLPRRARPRPWPRARRFFRVGGVVAARLGFCYRQTMCDKIVPTYDGGNDGGTTWSGCGGRPPRRAVVCCGAAGGCARRRGLCLSAVLRAVLVAARFARSWGGPRPRSFRYCIFLFGSTEPVSLLTRQKRNGF